jgi:hypothetical protein
MPLSEYLAECRSAAELFASQNIFLSFKTATFLYKFGTQKAHKYHS